MGKGLGRGISSGCKWRAMMRAIRGRGGQASSSSSDLECRLYCQNAYTCNGINKVANKTGGVRAVWGRRGRGRGRLVHRVYRKHRLAQLPHPFTYVAPCLLLPLAFHLSPDAANSLPCEDARAGGLLQQLTVLLSPILVSSSPTRYLPFALNCNRLQLKWSCSLITLVFVFHMSQSWSLP